MFNTFSENLFTILALFTSKGHILFGKSQSCRLYRYG